jgi:hypothetical protein
VHPTFIPFHPWTTHRDYGAFLERIGAYDLVASVAPIQLALRLLVPAGSLLLDLPEMAAVLGPFDAGRLVFPLEASRSEGRRPPGRARRTALAALSEIALDRQRGQGRLRPSVLARALVFTHAS